MANRIKYFILTGEPGVGKTTLTKKLTALANDIGIKTTGFYTEEVRKNRVREGFDVVTLDGNRGRLARDQSLISGPINYKVGKYAVLIPEFESVALSSLNKEDEIKSCLVIDEIGKMEFFSEPFKRRVKEIFSPNSDCIVLATIPIRKSDLFIESIRSNTSAKVWTVTRENRNSIHEHIIQEMKAAFCLALLSYNIMYFKNCKNKAIGMTTISKIKKFNDFK